MRQRELQRAQLALALLQVRRVPLIRQRKQRLPRRNPELRRHQQLVQCDLVWQQRLALHLLRLRDLQRPALLLDRLAHRQLIDLRPHPARTGRLAHHPPLNDIQQVLALLREQGKVGRRRDFDRRLPGKLVLEVLRDQGVQAHHVPADRPHVFHNAQVAVAEVVLGKVP